MPCAALHAACRELSAPPCRAGSASPARVLAEQRRAVDASDMLREHRRGRAALASAGNNPTRSTDIPRVNIYLSTWVGAWRIRRYLIIFSVLGDTYCCIVLSDLISVRDKIRREILSLTSVDSQQGGGSRLGFGKGERLRHRHGRSQTRAVPVSNAFPRKEKGKSRTKRSRNF